MIILCPSQIDPQTGMKVRNPSPSSREQRDSSRERSRRRRRTTSQTKKEPGTRPRASFASASTNALRQVDALAPTGTRRTSTSATASSGPSSTRSRTSRLTRTGSNSLFGASDTTMSSVTSVTGAPSTLRQDALLPSSPAPLVVSPALFSEAQLKTLTYYPQARTSSTLQAHSLATIHQAQPADLYLTPSSSERPQTTFQRHPSLTLPRLWTE